MLKTLWAILNGRWCILHRKAWKKGQGMCVDCFKRDRDRHLMAIEAKALERAKMAEIEKAVIVDNVLAAVKRMAKMANTIEELEAMLDEWGSFKHRS